MITDIFGSFPHLLFFLIFGPHNCSTIVFTFMHFFFEIATIIWWVNLSISNAYFSITWMNAQVDYISSLFFIILSFMKCTLPCRFSPFLWIPLNSGTANRDIKNLRIEIWNSWIGMDKMVVNSSICILSVHMTNWLWINKISIISMVIDVDRSFLWIVQISFVIKMMVFRRSIIRHHIFASQWIIDFEIWCIVFFMLWCTYNLITLRVIFTFSL